MGFRVTAVDGLGYRRSGAAQFFRSGVGSYAPEDGSTTLCFRAASCVNLEVPAFASRKLTQLSVSAGDKYIFLCIPFVSTSESLRSRYARTGVARIPADLYRVGILQGQESGSRAYTYRS